MPVHIIRLCRLYNEPARPARRASAGKPAQKARPAVKGVFDASKTWVRENLVLSDPRQPLIPGTPVKRLRLIPLGVRSLGAGDDDITRVKTELSAWREQELQAKADAATTPPPVRKSKAKVKATEKEATAS